MDKRKETALEKTEKRNPKERRKDKFIWSPADIKVQDVNGNRIRGDEFLDNIKTTGALLSKTD